MVIIDRKKLKLLVKNIFSDLFFLSNFPRRRRTIAFCLLKRRKRASKGTPLAITEQEETGRDTGVDKIKKGQDAIWRN